MATIATNKLWAYIESLSLSRRDRNWLAGKLLEPSFQTDPYEVSPSGDSFFADSRNVKAVEHDMAEAHRSGAKFTRLENKEDIMAMIYDFDNLTIWQSDHLTKREEIITTSSLH